jgi:hypothetical protein
VESIFCELNQLNGLAILNLQGVQSADRDLGTALKEFNCPSLQFLNVSCLHLKNLTLGKGLCSLVELIAHTNDLTDLRGLKNLPNIYLLDVENNFITDEFVPSGVEVLNTKFNSISTAILHIKVLNPTSVKHHSQF